MLGAVEAVDLVNEQQRALTELAPTLRCLEHSPKVRDAGEGGGKRFERKVGLLGEKPRDSGFPGPGRPPQHHRYKSLSVDHAPDRRVRRENMVLPDNIVQGARSEPIGQWPRGVVDVEE
ncbi:hypothetical protein GCM10022381_09420 [Leifsonia kafniensis]|uniref:Transposase n=1 Tax=Leifsonia kafniensis TaxID=475957 RepID=A0ABP7K7B8_9MICO